MGMTKRMEKRSKKDFKEESLREIFKYFRMKSYEREVKKLELQRLFSGNMEEQL